MKIQRVITRVIMINDCLIKENFDWVVVVVYII